MTTKYAVLVAGQVISRHRTADAARRAATAECKRQGLADDGAYCSDDGWPTIQNTQDTAERIDYTVPR